LRDDSWELNLSMNTPLLNLTFSYYHCGNFLVIYINYLQIICGNFRFVMKWATETVALRRHGARYNPNLYPKCSAHGFQTDEFWECVIRHYSQTIYHPTGTCKMGHKSDPMAVLDEELRVRGMDGLRVIDASIMPMIISGNTNAPVIMIAEKTADKIKDWWFKFGEGPFRPCLDWVDIDLGGDFAVNLTSTVPLINVALANNAPLVNTLLNTSNNSANLNILP